MCSLEELVTPERGYAILKSSKEVEEYGALTCIL